MAARFNLSSIPSIGDRKVFFDANVLIYIFWTPGDLHWANVYSSAFRSLLRQKNEFLVDFIVISEIVNRAHRLEYEKYLLANGTSKNKFPYKKYRNSADGRSALSDIYSIIETNILAHFTIVGKTFTKADIQSLLTVSPLDFADKGIVMTCKENACILITNDTDFKAIDIDIISCHPAMFEENE